MQLDDVLVRHPGFLVQTINVLGDNRSHVPKRFHSREGAVRLVGPGTLHRGPARDGASPVALSGALAGDEGLVLYRV